MTFQKASDFFYFIMRKHNLSRKDLAQIMGLNMPQIYNYLNAFTKPDRLELEKLAAHLGEKPEVFIELCFDPDLKYHTVPKPTYPNVRAEIIKHCYSKAARFEIVETEGVHNHELFISAYAYMNSSEANLKWIDAQKELEVVSQAFCTDAVQFYETHESERNKMFEILGNWCITDEGAYLFENAKPDAPPIRFFTSLKDAFKFREQYELTKETAQLVSDFKKLPEEQQKIVWEIIREKIKCHPC